MQKQKWLTQCRSRRWIRWTVVVAVWLAAYGAVAVVWHAITGTTWLYSLVFAGIVAVGNVVAQSIANRTKRKAAARHG
ncbi:hypothetical protein [Streptomyces phaeoluteigriseus]